MTILIRCYYLVSICIIIYSQIFVKFKDYFFKSHVEFIIFVYLIYILVFLTMRGSYLHCLWRHLNNGIFGLLQPKWPSIWLSFICKLVFNNTGSTAQNYQIKEWISTLKPNLVKHVYWNQRKFDGTKWENISIWNATVFDRNNQHQWVSV